jgi:hypothetical protein
MLRVCPVGPQPEVTLIELGPLPDAGVLQRVSAIWEAEIAATGKSPVNGPLISIASFTSQGLVGWIGEYRWFVAQRRQPSLFDTLRIRPLAVSGVLSCSDGVVFGRRASGVEMEGGLWELVPSGGVPAPARGGSVDLAGQLLAELEEEISIGRTAISAVPRAFVLVEDDESHVIDVGHTMRTLKSGAEIIAAFASRSTKEEYSELQVVAADRLDDYRRMRGPTLSAVSHALLDAARTVGLFQTSSIDNQ